MAPTQIDPSGDRRRRLDGWGFEDTSYEPSPQMLQWLAERFDPGEPFPRFEPESLDATSSAALPDLGCELSSGDLDRLAHARGRGFSDLVRLRSGSVPRLPDAVARPEDGAQVETVLRRAAEHGIRVIPWGGGTSVTGGVNVLAGDEPVVTLDLERLSGLRSFDEVSGLATFGAGTAGPQVESALAPLGFTLGHFPQSWELSTVGGWVATRSSGQESLGYGRIESLVAGLQLAAPGGRLDVPTLPASAAGPDLRHLVMGNEGRFGVITEASLRLQSAAGNHPRGGGPDERLAAGRRRGPSSGAVGLWAQPAAPLRRAGNRSGHVHRSRQEYAWGPLVRSWLKVRGFHRGACLLLLGASGGEAQVDDALARARIQIASFGSAWLGERPGRKWLHERFRHPYLRDGLFDHGIGTDTFETAAPWSQLDTLYDAVRQALRHGNGRGRAGDSGAVPSLPPLPRRGVPLLHLPSFAARGIPTPPLSVGPTSNVAPPKPCKSAGGTLSHHHGVGSWHAPWYGGEVGRDGLRLMQRLADEMDPQGVLNPHVLLPPEDRLLD